MIIPKVEQIAAAGTLLKTLPISTKQAELEELREFGTLAAQKLGARGMNPDFMTGYLLGLETARVWLADNRTAVALGVEF